MTSESTKMALGITNLSGPVMTFVPFDLPAHRGQALSSAQQQMLQIFDFLHFRNLGIEPASAPPGPGQPALPPPVEAVPAESLTPARSFLRAQDIPPAGVGAYGVLALTSRPTEASRQRLMMVCNAFLAALPTQSDLPPSVTLAQQMLTIWPIDTPPSGAAASDCNNLLDHYDLYGGRAAIRDAGKQGHTLYGRGPFLIGWSPSNSRYVADAVVLVIDMSKFETQDSFDDAFRFWQQKIVEDPSLWRSGFSVDLVRLAIRDFADHYGSEFLHAFKIGSD